MTLGTRALVLICPLFLASMQLIGSEVKQISSRIEELNHRFFTAIEDANIDQIRALLVKGADIEAKYSYDNTPLMEAARHGHTEVCMLLIERGADIEAKSYNGWTSLICAASSGLTEVCQLLMEKGADINAKDNDGYTSLIRAAWRGHTEICQLLIENGADIEAKTVDDYTPLICAAGEGRTEICMLLIEKDADINAKDNDGNTPLMEAARYGRTEICMLLMQRMLLQPIIKDRVPDACKQRLKEVLLVFNRRRGIPKEIARMILCNTPELEADLFYVLYIAHKRGIEISQPYMNFLRARWPQMVHLVCQKENLETVKRALEEARSKAGTEALRAILDPNTLESRIDDILGL